MKSDSFISLLIFSLLGIYVWQSIQLSRYDYMLNRSRAYANELKHIANTLLLDTKVSSMSLKKLEKSYKISYPDTTDKNFHRFSYIFKPKANKYVEDDEIIFVDIDRYGSIIEIGHEKP